jgi:ATP-dependent exoDNAse (exonuclease V) beta subunit
VERAARADFWQAAKSKEHSVETPFCVADAGHLTNGIIDLTFQTADGWQVIDYKTDVSLSAELYDRQLSAYRKALQKVGCRVVGASVIGMRSRGEEHMS